MNKKPEFHKQVVAWYVPASLAILPLGGMVICAALMFPYCAAIANFLGIGMNEPVIDHPNGTLFMIALFTYLVLLLPLGAYLGCRLNAAILYRCFGFSRRTSQDVALRGKFPESWFHSRPLFPAARPIPWNGAVFDYMLPLPAMKLAALPGTLAVIAFFSWAPLWDFSPENHETGRSFYAAALYMAVPLARAIAAWHLGWLLNVLVSKFVCRWPWPEIRSLYLRSEVPQAWLNIEKCRDPKAHAKHRILKDLETRLSVGRIRYILTRGVVLSGAGLFVAIYIAPMLFRGQPMWSVGALAYAIACAVGGGILGEAYWRSMQRHRNRLNTIDRG